MSSTSRPQTTGTSNIQPGQSPSKPPQVESTNPTPNVAQPLYQNNPNQQFIPNNIPLINPAQQLQLQSQFTNLQQTAAFLQRQTQFMQQQQQQQPNAVESQIKNQPLSNGPLSSFHNNFPELLNFFLHSNLNLPLSQLNPSQTPVQQLPLQTPKTVPVSPSKSGALQHTPRSATTGRPVSSSNINNAQTAEVNSATTPSPTVSAQNTENSKQLSTPSPIKSSSVSTVSTPSSAISVRLLEEVKERKNALLQATTKNPHDDTTMSNNTSPPKDIAQDIVSSPETSKSAVPRRKQTNVAAAAAASIKANPIISPSSHPTVAQDSVTLSTPKKSEEVKNLSNSPSTPLANVSKVWVPNTTSTTPTTPVAPATPTTTPATPPEKKVKPTKKEVTVQKSAKKNELESKTPSTTTNEQKPSTSSAHVAPSTSRPAPTELEIKSKRNRFKTNLYQSPTPELVLATRMSFSEANKNKNSVSSKDKLIIFFADEFIAVRNDEGTFFLCQCGHNMYKTSKKCRVRWLNKDDNSADTYKLTFYDHIDKECILTSVSMENVADNSYKLTDNERERIENILKKSIDVEKGLLPRPEVTEENPDGLDISLYKNESQIKSEETAGQKRKSENSSKSMSPTKKVKKDTKTSKNHTPIRRSTNSSSAETPPKKNEKSSKQSKPNVQRRSNDVKNVESTSSPSHESNTNAGKRKVAKTKSPRKSTASTASPSSPGPERTLRNRSKN